MIEIVKHSPVMAILRHLPLAQTASYVNAALQGGVRAFEVAMNTPHALEQIRLIRQLFSQVDIRVGAGTALTPGHCRAAMDAGAQFLLSPASDARVLQYCRDNHIPFLPGVMTPSDVALCVNYGFRVLKLFPASDLPKGYIKSLKGPFDTTEYVAVGGVSPENIRSFFETGFAGVGIGSNLIPRDLLETQQWEAAAETIKAMIKKACLKEEMQ